MYRFAAALLALTVTQQEPPPAAPSSPTPAPAAARPEREQVLRAALAFVDALLEADARALVSGSTPRFSFDGELADGADAQLRRWREIFGVRRAGAEALRDLVLLGAADAVTQLGPPPPRIAGLVKAGTWVAVADVSGRPVVLVLMREGGRFAVAGMHD